MAVWNNPRCSAVDYHRTRREGQEKTLLLQEQWCKESETYIHWGTWTVIPKTNGSRSLIEWVSEWSHVCVLGERQIEGSNSELVGLKPNPAGETIKSPPSTLMLWHNLLWLAHPQARCSVLFFLRCRYGDFSGGPVAETPHSQCSGPGFGPSLGN